jgi:isocitrate dehydrogenase kinase/phosphatase
MTSFSFGRPLHGVHRIGSAAYHSYYPNRAGLRQTIRDICNHFDWHCSFANLSATSRTSFRRRAADGRPAARGGGQLCAAGAALGLLLQQAAYIVGKAINGDTSTLVVPALHDANSRLFLDAILPTRRRSALVQPSRAYS